MDYKDHVVGVVDYRVGIFLCHWGVLLRIMVIEKMWLMR